MQQDVYAVATRIANANFEPVNVQVMNTEEFENVDRSERGGGLSGLSGEWNAMQERRKRRTAESREGSIVAYSDH